MSEKPQNPFIITRPTPLISRSEGPTRDDSPERASSDPKRSQGTTARSEVTIDLGPSPPYHMMDALWAEENDPAYLEIDGTVYVGDDSGENFWTVYVP